MGRRSREDIQSFLKEGERLIQEEGMSHTNAALAVGVSQGTMSRYMRDRSKKPKAAKKASKKAKPTITEVAPIRGMAGSKTLLIISEDSELIAKLIERYYS